MTDSLRIVACNALPLAWEIVAEWAQARGHRIVLTVTPPAAQAARYGSDPGAMAEAVGPEGDLLVTAQMERTLAPVVAALAPDLLVVATFPFRLPESVTRVPRLGAVNLHPTPLPAGRGPNPQRLVYEGHPDLGAALHRVEPEFDAGRLLSVRRSPADAYLTPETLLRAWGDLLRAALGEGTARLLAGDPGEPQDEARATHAAPFTDAERRLDWNEPAAVIQRKATALNLGRPTARARLGSREVVLADVVGYPGKVAQPPGFVLARDGDQVTVACKDGTVRARVAGEGDSLPPRPHAN